VTIFNRHHLTTTTTAVTTMEKIMYPKYIRNAVEIERQITRLVKNATVSVTPEKDGDTSCSYTIRIGFMGCYAAMRVTGEEWELQTSNDFHKWIVRRLISTLAMEYFLEKQEILNGKATSNHQTV
jgi:hypothetical protein